MEKNIFKKALERELIPALGCTEPMGFALIAAVARKYAPGKVKRIHIECDTLDAVGVQAVGIPNTNGKHGGCLSAALGVVAGRADLGTLVLDQVTEADVKEAEALVEQGICTIEMVTEGSNAILYIKATVETDSHTAVAIMEGTHDESGIRYIEQDGKILLNNRVTDVTNESVDPSEEFDLSIFTLENIYNYCKTCDLDELELIKESIRLSRVVAKDGLEKPLGLQCAKTLRENVQKGIIKEDELVYILIWTIAGVDARMGGSDYPAMLNGGSGNQGIIVTMAPVAAAEYRNCSQEDMLRAAAMSNLVNIWIHWHTKEYAYAPPMCYCSTSACVAAAVGVAFLHGADQKNIADIVCTGMGLLPGVICDGAKPSCAYRAMTGLCGTLEAMLLAEKGIRSSKYEGFLNETPEGTMQNIYSLQKDCMNLKMSHYLWEIKKQQKTIC